LPCNGGRSVCADAAEHGLINSQGAKQRWTSYFRRNAGKSKLLRAEPVGDLRAVSAKVQLSVQDDAEKSSFLLWRDLDRPPRDCLQARCSHTCQVHQVALRRLKGQRSLLRPSFEDLPGFLQSDDTLRCVRSTGEQVSVVSESNRGDSSDRLQLVV